jgi:small subunit ribosomal protein S21
MVSVYRDDGESFESMFKRFRKVVQKEKIRSEVRKRRYYEKPSMTRKRKARKKLIKSRRSTLKAERRMRRY